MAVAQIRWHRTFAARYLNLLYAQLKPFPWSTYVALRWSLLMIMNCLSRTMVLSPQTVAFI